MPDPTDTAPPTDNSEQPVTAARRWSVERYTSLGWALGAYLVFPAWGIHDRSLTVRLGRRSVTFHREREGQPWPDVGECHLTKQECRESSCMQHDPTHEHTWQAGKPWRLGGMIPVRCVVCGGRKCDQPRCVRIRHHDEDHSDWLGYNGTVVNAN